MKLIIIILIVLIFVILISATYVTASRRDQSALKKSLAYLHDIPEISWVVIVRNNIYIGFNKRIKDMGAICRGAAVNGNRAYGFGVHIYAVDGYQADWRKSKHYCAVTARSGRVTKSSCK